MLNSPLFIIAVSSAGENEAAADLSEIRVWTTPGRLRVFPAQNLGPKMCGEGKIEGYRGSKGSVLYVRKQG